MSTDAELLQRFVADRSETAFTDLVHRYLVLVRATALRRVGGDAHAADDVTQQVFVSLARNASSLRNRTTIAGWLYVTTHHATAELVRGEQRRKQREATAHSMHLTDSSAGSPDDVARLRPLLDDALITLKPDEREAIVLRYFSNRTFSEIGKTIQLSEEAARKRVDRALEKLHAVLIRRGITSTVAVLGTALTAAGLNSAPAGLALKVAGGALTEAAASGVVASFSLASVFWPATTAAVLVVGTFALVSQHGTNTGAATAIALQESRATASIVSLETENQRLARDVADANSMVAASIAPAADVEVRAPAPAPAPGTSAGMTVFVSTDGTLQWEGKPVTLDGFLVNLTGYQASAPNGESRLVIKANGARFSQLDYVLEEARKAGIKNLVVESDALPDDGRMPNTWF
ncbi:MAG TPA: sigma-70 family RNA polymerase sigma factor [Lacunisphaera sp.]|jgi:RNA polymerase sigma factor (sigma-70 family)